MQNIHNNLSKDKIFNSVLGANIYQYIKDNKDTKPKRIQQSYNPQLYYEYNLIENELPIILKNIKQSNREFKIKIDVKDNILNLLNDCLCKKRRKDNPKLIENRKHESTKKENASTIKIKQKVFDEDEEIFPEKKMIEKPKIELKIEMDNDDDIFRYKDISLSELLKKKKI